MEIMVNVWDNPLSDLALNTHIPALRSRGVHVSYGTLTPAVEQERDILRGVMELLKVEQ